MHDLDLVLVNPGGREQIYQELGEQLTAVEPPLWCGIIANNARIHGLSVKIIDTEAERLGPEAAAARIAQMRPTVVGLIVYGHQPSASTQQMVGARMLASALKKHSPDLQIIIVGGHVAALPERTLNEEPVDFACNSEGPLTIRELVRQLQSSAPDFEAVPGLVWRGESGDVRHNLTAPLIQDLDAELPGSAWDLLPMDKYRAHNWQCFGDLSKRVPYASIYTSLGCPYKCSFCCINAPFGRNGYRMRSPENVVAEIDHLVKTYNVRTYKFVDEMFVLNERHLVAICDLLIERDYGLNIWAYSRIDTVKPHYLNKLKRAGFQWLALGIESGSRHVRDGARKALKNNDIVDIVRMIQDHGINVIGNYIFGLPDDDMESMQATLDLAKELNCEFANFYSAMAYPGSPLYSMAVEKGWELPKYWSGYSQHSYDCRPLDTEHVGAAEVLAFRDAAFDSYFTDPRYLDMVEQKFGAQTREHIEQMTRHKLRRQLLEPAKKVSRLESVA